MKRHFTISTQGKILNFLAIVFLIFTVVSSFLTMVANDNAAKIRDRKYEFTKNINLFSDACVYLTDQVRTYAATKEQHHYDNYWNEVNNDCRREASQETLYTLGITDQEKALIDEVQQISNKLVPFEELAMEAVSNNDIDKALSILYGEEYEVGVEKISSIVDDLNDSIAQRTNSELAHQKKMVSINTVETFTCMLLVILIQLYNILFVKRKLLVPLDKVKNSISQLAEGNLSAELDLPEDTTEIGQLVSAFNKNTYNLRIIISDLAYLTSEMSNGNFDINTEHEDKYIGDYGRIIQSLRNINRKLNTALTDIKNSAEQVNAGSEQVSGGAQALSQGATEQASSIEELSATINDITNKIRENAENAKIAGKESQEAGQGVSDSNAYMKQMIEAMEDITEKSNEIGNIIKTIDDIAFQTNILALNAAVEAARAGAAGKGFAVVADEVRNLAAKSAEAAKGTTALIEGAIEAVQNGTKIANNTANALGVVVEKAGGVNKLIQQIAKASEEQANGVAQVSIGVDQISAVVQTNSATAEESAAASEELSSQATMLKEMLNQFTFR